MIHINEKQETTLKIHSKVDMLRLIDYMFNNENIALHTSHFKCVEDLEYFQDLCEEHAKEMITRCINEDYETFSKALTTYKFNRREDKKFFDMLGLSKLSRYIAIHQKEKLLIFRYSGENIEDLQAWLESN